MGYESKLIVVRKSELKFDNLFFAERIAEFNLCCVDNEVMTLINTVGKDTDCTVDYDDHGNGINIDKYGEVCKEFTLDDMIAILKEGIRASDYHRYPACLAMLESFKLGELRGQWNDLVVIHYGY